MICYQGLKVYLDSTIPAEAMKWRNDKRIWKWCRQYTLLTLENHAGWMHSLQTSDEHRMYGIYALVSKKPIGVCGLTNIDKHNQKAEFSLYIDPEQHIRGYGRDALLSLLRHGFDDHNLNCIWGETYDGNPAARLFGKLGMDCEGRMRERYFRDGRFIDTLIYSMVRRQWRSLCGNFFSDLRPVDDTNHVDLSATEANVQYIEASAQWGDPVSRVYFKDLGTVAEAKTEGDGEIRK